MIRIVASSAVLAISAGAMAAPFALLSYEAGGGLLGVVDQGYRVSAGGFFNVGGTTVGQSGDASGFTAANYGEFDSHFALDGFGPAARNRSGAANLPNNSTTTTSFYGNYGAPGTAAANYNEGETIAGYSFIQAPGSHIGDPGDSGSAATPNNLARAGVGVAPPPVFSTFAPNATGGRSQFDGVFVGRFTIQAGATLSGGFFTTLAGGQGAGSVVLDGPAVAIGAQVFGLRSYKVATVDIQAPSSSGPSVDGDGNDIPFGLADVYDLWFQVIPTPGAVALFGLGGIAAIRRRRA